MRALAKKLGTARRGALVAYFADEQDWRVWIGEESAAAFLGRAATPADLAPEGALHRAKEAFFNAAAEAGDLEFARQQQAAPPDKQPPPAQRLKLRTDALLDTLILKLEPKSTSPEQAPGPLRNPSGLSRGSELARDSASPESRASSLPRTQPSRSQLVCPTS
jgi:hypothetical protein